MPRIRQLDALVINKIAAGEVIERPGSVVKELLENSLDALATRVEVDVVQGGSELIRVVDNGEGIHPDDMLLAVTSHATSKISAADDLESVQTMGFRGEALASIAAVSSLRIRSRQTDADSGYQLLVAAGQVGQLQPCGSPSGTLIEVQRLFTNTPVRRKFLKTAATEFGHISEQFTRIALAHPRLHAVLRHNGKSVYELPATAQLIDRLKLFYGSELAEKLIWVESQSDSVRLWGYVARPDQSRSTRKGQYLFLNGRWIQDRSLQHALSEAYRGLLMVGRQPIAFLFLELPSNLVDVNVHPKKSEVRFRESQQLYRQLLSTLRNKFLGMDLAATMRIPDSTQTKKPASPPDPGRQRELKIELSTWAKERLSRGQASDNIGELLPKELSEVGSPPSHGVAEMPAGESAADDQTPSDPADTVGSSGGLLSGAAVHTDGSAQDTGIQQADVVESATRQPRCPVSQVMQIHDSYLVAETDEGLTVIDQHALHERVIYEQLRRRVLSEVVETQRLLVPETIELGQGEMSALIEQREMLSQLGFGIEEFGKNTVLLSGYPPMLARADLVALIRDVAEQLLDAGQKPTRGDILDDLLQMMSCKAAIKAGQPLSSEEMESLLAQRHLIDDAHHCPHGRPTALVLNRAELDRQFGRLG